MYAYDGGFRIHRHFSYSVHITDLFAIPDFAAGAMENWGLITYRETAIFYDPQSTSSADKQWVGVVISHELAHQVKLCSVFATL